MRGLFRRQPEILTNPEMSHIRKALPFISERQREQHFFVIGAQRLGTACWGLEPERSCRYCWRQWLTQGGRGRTTLVSSYFHPQSTHAHMLSCLSHIRLFVTPWTVVHQSFLSIGFSRQEYWSGLPFPFLGDLPNPRTKPVSLTSPALAGSFFSTGAIWEAQCLALAQSN